MAVHNSRAKKKEARKQSAMGINHFHEQWSQAYFFFTKTQYYSVKQIRRRVFFTA